MCVAGSFSVPTSWACRRPGVVGGRERGEREGGEGRQREGGRDGGREGGEGGREGGRDGRRKERANDEKKGGGQLWKM